MDWVRPGLLGSREQLRRIYVAPVTRAAEPGASSREKELGESRQKELQSITDPFFLRRTSEVLAGGLPARFEIQVFCSPSPLQARLYQHLVRSRKVLAHPAIILGEVKEWEESSNIGGGADEAKVLEMWSANKMFPPGYETTVPKIDDSPKLLVLRDLISSVLEVTKDKAVICSNYTQTLDMIEGVCIREHWHFLRLDGSTPTARRMSLIDNFNDPRTHYRLFLLSAKAGGIGVNLIGANRMIVFDPDFNPANDHQAMARVWREGQKRPVFIYRLFTSGTLEEKILQRQFVKLGLSDSITKRGDVRQAKWSREHLRRLFHFDPDVNCETYNEDSCSRGDVEFARSVDHVFVGATRGETRQMDSIIRFVKVISSKDDAAVPVDDCGVPDEHNDPSPL